MDDKHHENEKTDFPHLDSTPHSESEWFAALMALARYLRSPEGCPWDREKGSRDFAEFACGEARELTEAYEAAAEPASPGTNSHIAEELGDALFCLLAAAAAAEEEGRLVLADTLAHCHAKMIRRHGHLFGAYEANTPEEVAQVWRTIKAREAADEAEPFGKS